jgi:hypothetical protein
VNLAVEIPWILGRCLVRLEVVQSQRLVRLHHFSIFLPQGMLPLGDYLLEVDEACSACPPPDFEEDDVPVESEELGA